jgi:hypothetical protein
MSVPLRAGCEELDVDPLTQRCLNPLCNLGKDMHVFEWEDEILINAYIHDYIDLVKYNFLPLLRESAYLFEHSSKHVKTLWGCQFTSVYDLQHCPKLTMLFESSIAKFRADDAYIDTVLVPKLAQLNPESEILVWVRVDLHTRAEEEEGSMKCFQSSAILSVDGARQFLDQQKSREQQQFHHASI